MLKILCNPDIFRALVTPIYKAGDNSDVSNYRPISVLPCFSKILERSMYNRLYKYLKENNILYEKQFGFQSGYSTNDAIVQLVDKNLAWFESYLSNRKQHIEKGENSKTDLKYVTCGVPKDLFLDHFCF